MRKRVLWKSALMLIESSEIIHAEHNYKGLDINQVHLLIVSTLVIY